MLLRFFVFITIFDVLLHIFDLFAQRKLERLLPAKVILPLNADIFDTSKVAQRRAKVRIPTRRSILRRIDRQDVTLAAPCGKAQLAHRPRIGTQEEIAERRIFLAVLRTQTFHIERNCSLFACGLRDDIDDAADRIGAVLRARRPANDFDALDILRAKPHHLVACAAILRHIPEDRMSIDHDQGMPRLRSANRHADIPHRIDRARHADLAEDDVLNRLRLLLRNIVCRNDRRRLRFVFRLFFRRISFDVYRFGLNLCTPPAFSFAHTTQAGSIKCSATAIPSARLAFLLIRISIGSSPPFSCKLKIINIIFIIA